MERATDRRAPLDGDEASSIAGADRAAALADDRAGSAVGGPALTRMLIDCMPWPAALVAGDGAVAFANRRAQACPRMATLPWQDRRQPAAIRDGPGGVPPDALHEALRRALDDPDAGLAVLRWPLSGRSSPVCAGVLPLPGTALLGPQALVTVHDPQSTVLVDRVLLTRLLCLTPVEARVVARLMEGQSPGAIAAETGTSIPAVRSQLQAVFSKLAADRQAHRVRLLLSLPSIISIPPNTPAWD